LFFEKKTSFGLYLIVSWTQLLKEETTFIKLLLISKFFLSSKYLQIKPVLTVR
jgi:hypothetical protein